MCETGAVGIESTTWCPTCGCEYRAGVDRCADCGDALVPDRPEILPGETCPEEIRYGLSDWTEEQRTTLRWILDSEEIGAIWEGTDVVVADTVETRLDDLVTWIESEPRRPGESDQPGPPGTVTRAESTRGRTPAATQAQPPGTVAGPLRRLAGYVADAAVISVAQYLLFILASSSAGGHEGTGAPWSGVMVAAFLAYSVVPVALWGRTPGKVLAGTRVVSSDCHAVPGWGSAFTRWLVPAAPGFALGPLGGSPTLSFLVFSTLAVIYGTLLLDPLRRGIHDRLARTLVVLA